MVICSILMRPHVDVSTDSDESFLVCLVIGFKVHSMNCKSDFTASDAFLSPVHFFMEMWVLNLQKDAWDFYWISCTHLSRLMLGLNRESWLLLFCHVCISIGSHVASCWPLHNTRNFALSSTSYKATEPCNMRWGPSMSSTATVAGIQAM